MEDKIPAPAVLRILEFQDIAQQVEVPHSELAECTDLRPSQTTSYSRQIISPRACHTVCGVDGHGRIVPVSLPYHSAV